MLVSSWKYASCLNSHTFLLCILGSIRVASQFLLRWIPLMMTILMMNRFQMTMTSLLYLLSFPSWFPHAWFNLKKFEQLVLGIDLHKLLILRYHTNRCCPLRCDKVLGHQLVRQDLDAHSYMQVCCLYRKSQGALKVDSSSFQTEVINQSRLRHVSSCCDHHKHRSCSCPF